MIVLETFLCCFKLRSGCLFIGYSGAISSILVLIGSVVGIFITSAREATLKGDNKLANEIIMGACIYLLIVCALNFALSVILLVGVHERRTKLMNIYLNCMIAYLVLTFIVALVFAVYKPSNGLSYIMSFAWSIYYLLVIRSHRLELEQSEQPMGGVKRI